MTASSRLLSSAQAYVLYTVTVRVCSHASLRNYDYIQCIRPDFRTAATSPFVARDFIQSAHTSGNRWAGSAYRITETLRTPQMTRRNNAIMRIACDRPRIPLGFNVIIIVKGHFLRTAVNIHILEVAILRNEPCSWRQDSHWYSR